MPSANAKAHGAPATSRQSKISQEDQADLDAIHSTIRRMQAITPPDPYILTIPQEVEPRYHHYRNQQWQWLDHTPFHHREREEVQYQTFHYYEHGEEMYVLHNSQLVDTKEEESRGASRIHTAGSTPNGTAPKKKITLDAYKKKLAGTPVPDSTQEKRRDEPPRSQPAPPDHLRNNELKRKRDAEHAEARETLAKERDTAAKKSRPTDPPHARSRTVKTSPQISRTAKSPERRSAALPPKLSPLGVPSLPDRLSPTIPPNIKATLREREQARALDKSANDPATKDGATPRTKHTVERSDTKERSRALDTSAAQSTTSPELSQSDDIVATRRGFNKANTTSKIVRLKYRKKQTAAILRILKSSPRPGRESSPLAITSKESTDSDEEPLANKVLNNARGREFAGKGIAQKLGPASSGTSKPSGDAEDSEKRRVSEKRPAPDPSIGSERSAKRPRQLAETSSQKEPSTPVQPDVNSPSLQSSNQQGEQITPTIRKNLLSTAKRDKHTDSPTADAGTPTVGTQGAQANGSLGNGVQRPPSSQSSKTPMQNAWELDQKRLDALGRELKHSATADLNSAQSSQSKGRTEQKLAAVKSIESLLSYILAFTCSDQAALAADPKQNPPVHPWRSLRGFYLFVKMNCEPFPLLCGLACWLGAVSFAHTLDMSSRNPSEGPSRDTILDLSGLMHRAATQGEAKLDLDNLIESFPQTWRQRARGPIPSTLDAPAKLAGKFKLPIGVQTPPFQAARAGHSMLEEWIANEEIGYSLKLKL